MNPLVSTAWLADRLHDPHVRAVDASWYLPAAGRDPAAEFGAAHIPGAVRFDLDQASDPASPLPHMLPSAERFAARMSALGLGDDDMIVAYDASGTNLSAPRAWWMFRVFGHDRVAVLDGGFGAWQRERRPVESGDAAPRAAGRFTARYDPALVRDAGAVLEVVRGRGGTQLIDARSAGRFAGTEPEPRPGLRGGHIPGSRSVPFSSVVDETGRMRSPDELRRILGAAGVDVSRPAITSCGSGVTACAVALALEVAGMMPAAVYDGSWSEWGGRADLPVETGPPRTIEP